MAAAAMGIRRNTGWPSGVAISMALHAVVLAALNQLPTARVRLLTREVVLTVDLMEPPPPQEPPEAPPQERAPLAEPPPSLLDMSAAALPEPGVDLLRDLPPPTVQLQERAPLDLPQPTLELTERRLPRVDDKHTTLSLGGDFTPSLPGDKLDVGVRRDAMVVPPTAREDLSPRPSGPTHVPRTVGYPTPRPAPQTGAPPAPPPRAASASRSLAVPAKPTVGVPTDARGEGGRRRIRTVEPPVPSWVEEQGIEAYAKLRIQILEDGRIGTVELTMSSGYRELDNLAIGAVKQWLYEPGLVEYRAVRVNFKLR